MRAEFWGDEIVDLRHFELATQRSTRAVEFAVVLPIDGQVREDVGSLERASITTLFPPDTLLVLPRGGHAEPELRRTWEEAQHHIDLARRRGEDAPARDELFESPETTLAALRRFGTIAAAGAGGGEGEGEGEGHDGERDAERDVVFTLRPPEPIDRDIKQLKRLVRDGTPTIILCDNEGQADRLDELLSEDDWSGGRMGGGSPAALSIGVLDGGFVIPAGATSEARGLRILTDHEIFRRERRIRRARRYITTTALDTVSLKPGDYVVHLEHGRGDLPRHGDDLRRAEHDRGRGRRVRRRRSAQRSALSYRPARTVSLRR